MDEAELRRRVAEILAEEERDEPDWARVEDLCAALDERLRGEPDTECPDSVYHFIDDADIRQRDGRYADGQRDLVRRYVETGEMTEHAESVQISPWGCGLFILAAIGLLIWLLT